MPASCGPAISVVAVYSERPKGPVLFSPLNTAAVTTQELVADRDTGHVQTLMDQPECVSGLQGLAVPQARRLEVELSVGWGSPARALRPGTECV